MKTLKTFLKPVACGFRRIAIPFLIFIPLSVSANTPPPGFPGAALNFDGTDDYVQLAPTSTFDIGAAGNFTFECWVKRSSTGTTDFLFSHLKTGFVHGYQIFINSADILTFQFSIGGTDYFNTGVTTIPANIWTHVAVTMDRATTTMKMYINGVLDATIFEPGYSGNNNFGVIPTYLGMDRNFSASAALSGDMDEARYWNRVLCIAEIQKNMNCQLAGTETGLLGYYQFNEGIGSGSNPGFINLPDISGNGNSGTLNNFALTGSTSNWIEPGAVVTGTSCGLAFGASTWLVHVFKDASPDLDLISSEYYGNYTHAGLSFDSQSLWAAGASPASAPGYSGCDPGIDNHIVIYKRQGFPFGNYQLDIDNGHDDDVRVYVDGLQVFEHIGCCDNHSNIWSGALGPLSTVEYRWVEFGGGSKGSLSLLNPAAALNFDGIGMNDYVHVPLNVNETEYTAEAWFKTTLGGGILSIQAGNLGSSGYDRMIRVDASGNVGAYTWALEVITSSGTDYRDGNWHHVAHVLGVTIGGQKLYVDGILVASGVLNTSSFNWEDRLTIGYENIYGYFNGDLDEVRIWNRALSQCEIQNNMNCEIPTTGTGLLCNYHFNQGQAADNNPTETSLTDASGNANTGTLINFALTGSTSNWIAPGAVTTGSSCGAFPSFPSCLATVAQHENCVTNNGAISLAVSGGCTPYSFLWSNAATTQNISGLAAGTYTVTVTDANLNTCNASATIIRKWMSP